VNTRRMPVLLVAGLAFALNLGLPALISRPVPLVHDEFSYLLAADTFASGRLTNPTHPMWRHFETFHVIHQPSYQSKYPPGQGLALAAGQLLTGRPIVGVWISLALACGALCWMLQGWLPTRWALLGAGLATSQPTILAAWGQTYWGGAVAMLGGALVFGALPRLLRRIRKRHAFALAAGLAMLANSRPMEGLIAGLCALAVLIGAALAGRMGPPRRLWSDLAVPVLATLAVCALGMAYYNWRVTGDPIELPYQTWWRQYQGPEAGLRFAELSEWRGSADGSVLQKLRRLRQFYFPFALWIPVLSLLSVPWLWGVRGVRLAMVTCGLVLAASTHWSTGWPHYCAPVACLLSLLAAQGLRLFWHTRVGESRPLRFLVALIPALQLGFLPLFFLRQDFAVSFRAQLLARERIAVMLDQQPSHHLVLVHYHPNHLVHAEWVYNRADIDRAKVVWARDLGPAQNEELLAYFRDRRVWLLDADTEPPRLRPYPSAGDSRPAR